MAGGYEQVLESENVDPKLLGQGNTENHAILDAQVNINFLSLIAFSLFVFDKVKIDCMSTHSV